MRTKTMAPLLLALVLPTTTVLALPSAASASAPAKRTPGHASWLIDYSTVTAPMFAAGLPQDNPFDGVVVRGADDQDPWNCARLGAQTGDIASLAAGRALEGRYAHNFLHVWTLAPPATWTWADRACTNNLVAGFTTLAATAKAGGFDGLMLDVETYGQGDPWDNVRSTYATVKATGTRIGRALAGQGEVLYMTMAQSASISDPTTYGAMPSFVQGVLAGGATVIDGNLPSYWYGSASAYSSAQANLKKAQPGELVGQATYIDAAPSIPNNVTDSILYSDRYAWVYTDGAYGSWWGSPAMYPPVRTEVEAGRQAAGLPA